MVGIPLIDLRLAAGGQLEELRDACERLGCFRVCGHGVPAALQAEMKAAVRVLFDLPGDAKRRNTGSIFGSSYMAPNPINPLFEAFGFTDAGVPADVDAFCSSLDVPPRSREIVKRYARAMQELMVDVAGKVAASLGHHHQFQDWMVQLRMNMYNYTRDTVVGSPGLGIHTDSAFLTMLQEDDCVGGLEVLDPAVDEFVPVDPLPGTFMFNIGDVGTAWSNGRLHAVKHRVRCVAQVPRISIGMFLLAPKDGMVSAPEEFVDADHPRRFKPFFYNDYMKLRESTAEHAGQALARIRV